MNYVVAMGMVKRLANLTSDVLQVPDGKSVFARESSRNRIALNVFSGSEQQIAFIARAIEGRNVVAA